MILMLMSMINIPTLNIIGFVGIFLDAKAARGAATMPPRISPAIMFQ
jgi:hypothetical protein